MGRAGNDPLVPRSNNRGNSLVSIGPWTIDGKKLYCADSDFDILDRLSEIAAQRGLPNSQIALSWILDKPAITAPIIGATKPEHLADAVAALSVRLSQTEINQLEELYMPHTVLDHT